MASNLTRKKNGPFTVTRNLSTGSINVSTSAGHRAHRITQSAKIGGRFKITQTFRHGNMFRRTSKIIGPSAVRRSKGKSLFSGLASFGSGVMQSIAAYEPPPDQPKDETPPKTSKIVDFGLACLVCMFVGVVLPKTAFLLWILWIIWIVKGD